MNLLRKLRKKKKKNDVKETENIEKIPPGPPRFMQFKPESLIKRRKIEHHMILVRLSTITVRNWVTIPTNIQSQKTSFGLGDFLVGD